MLTDVLEASCGKPERLEAVLEAAALEEGCEPCSSESGHHPFLCPTDWLLGAFFFFLRQNLGDGNYFLLL